MLISDQSIPLSLSLSLSLLLTTPLPTHLLCLSSAVKMKFSVFALLPAVALALPTSGETSAATVTVRQTASTITDQLLFQSTLPQFTAKRNARDPPTLDWASDGCSSSPDNPFGFPFVPACHRHDFGYRNYKVQARFTDANRLKIDDNFKKE